MRSEAEIRAALEDLLVVLKSQNTFGSASADTIAQVMLAKWVLGEDAPGVLQLRRETKKAADAIRKIAAGQARHHRS